jgi:hypothetical protein
MNVDKILATMNEFGVAYLLIGGMNFMLRHEPTLLTFDVDLWIDDTGENRRRCELALNALGAEWGATDIDWAPVSTRPTGWLERQAIFSLNTPFGAVDIFRSLPGVSNWQSSFEAARHEQTGGGVNYHGLGDADMLQCQLVLDSSIQKPSRVQKLQSALSSQQ